MDFTGITGTNDAIQPLAHLLDVITRRQELVSHNIANANTPGYTARHISFAQMLERATNPFETRLSQKIGPSLYLETYSGDPVNLQQEMLDMHKNNLYFGMATRRLSTMFSLLKAAIQVR
jgi:flagellar basal-body rod protein FlgB